MFDTLSIKEFSKLTGIESSTLRYWENIGLFTPYARNPTNNYRHYSTEQLPALNFVTTLCDLDVPNKTICDIKNARTPKLIIELFDEHAHHLNKQLYNLSHRYSVMQIRRELMLQGLEADINELSIQEMPAMAISIRSRNEGSEKQTFLEHISETALNRVNLSFPVAGYHESIEAFTLNPGSPDYFISIDPHGTDKKKASEYLVGYAMGNYGEVGDVHNRLSAFIRDNKLFPVGPVYTIYLHDEICTENPDNYLVQICVEIFIKIFDKIKEP